MWGIDGGGHLRSKNFEVTYTQKSCYCFSCQYTHGCGMPASWAAQHTMCVLMIVHYFCQFQYFFIDVKFQFFVVS